MRHSLLICIMCLMLLPNSYKSNTDVNQSDIPDNQLPFTIGSALSYYAEKNIYFYMPSGNNGGTLTLIRETYSSSITNDDLYDYVPAEDSDNNKDSLTIIKETYH